MLVVRVELWPGGREDEATEIGRAALANLTPTADVADYIAVALDARGWGTQRIVRRHRRDAGLWPLLSRAFAPGGPRRLPVRWREAGALIAETAKLDRPAAPTGPA